MNLDKDRINELVREVNKYPSVYLPRENYIVTSTDRRLVGKNECFGRGINLYRNDTSGGKVIFSVKVNFEPEICHPFRDSLVSMVENNLVMLNSDQLIDHMNYLRERLGLSFDMDYYKRKNTYLRITVCDHRNVGQVRLILFWLREAYAFPYNIYLIDSYVLYEKHPEIELYNLITIPALSSLSSRNYGLNFSRYRDFISSEELKSRLQHENLHWINGSYSSPELQYLFKDLSPARKSKLDIALNKLQLIEPPANNYCQNDGGRTLRYMSWWNNTDRFELFEKVLQKRLEI